MAYLSHRGFVFPKECEEAFIESLLYALNWLYAIFVSIYYIIRIRITN
jgi:hypothetical protein